MEIVSEATTDRGVTERRFDLMVEGQRVPGMQWWPAGEQPGGRPTVLVGHGGFQSKTAPNIVELATQLAVERGYATISLDAPHHGERRSEEQIRQQEETLERLRTRGVGDGASSSSSARPARPPRPTNGDEPSDGEVREPRMVREWKALLDRLEAEPELGGGGPFGYWGVSMGCRYGIPLVATEPRIRAAVLGLFGLLPDPAFRAAVASISIPLLFLFQFDDELMTPDAGLALWSAFGSTEKTMHINPGPHVGIPRFERDAASAFFARHLD
jgi:dienelactone hydrolase